ncbi:MULTISPECIES: Na+/H+ antiporter NhaC family protein [Rossellomorea]|uniref:Na+/H+ antiporter NhaC family protein n=1 Tax=Rossellomorea TaxID=2837508 RepID=UPI00064F58D6|nr:Na+/H+ antiporter NhaC family protein [Rossellomorea marisflavi]KML05077.1 sodium:proton antiporter [Rossellomorea marisflavi]MBV6684398.1 Na+/H+ antiporter NhaC family protein [Bacillus sp. JRC01]
MENTIYSLIPPLLAILMVVLTRRVLLSLGVGIVSSALLIAKFSPMETLSLVWDGFIGNLYADGELNKGNIYIILFLLLLGIITAFINITGGSRAFGEWAIKRVKTRRGGQLLAAVLGIIIFIDDYFNALAVGQVARPVTDRNNISRAKLAYIIDSTSAPICVVSPVSSWGAYIIGIMGSILATHGVTQYTAFSAFLQVIPMNLYVWATILFVLLIAVKGIDFGKMREHEMKAITTGELYDPQKEIPGELKNELPVSKQGTVGDLVWPIVALVLGTVGAMLWTGYSAVGTFDLLKVFENTDVTLSLILGGIIGFIVSLLFVYRQMRLNGIEGSAVGKGIAEGVKAMLPAVYILFFAWTIVTLIGELETGKYLAGLVQQSNIPVQALPFILFVVAGFMAFSTGTSWGSFGLLLPIAGEIAANTDITILLPSMAAVLAGSVFGDHCSPISDTTILSSTGAGSNHIDHVLTQLPYALIAASVAGVGYLVLGFTENTWIALLTVIVLTVAAALALGRKNEGEADTAS